MGTLRSLVSFASWNYGAQAVTIVLQLGYAAVTSRLVDDAGFGAYAVALGVAAVINLLANGGLGQTVGRMQDLVAARISALLVYALMLGGAGAVVLFATADMWAALWGAPASVIPIRVLAVSALVGPAAGLLSGLLRRQQRYRTLAGVVVATNGLGMGAGVLSVILAPGPVALLVSPTVAMLLLTVVTCWFTRDLVLTRPTFRPVGDDLRFSWSVTGLSLISYLNSNLGRWGLSRGVGADVLGQWNRADVLTTVPLEQAQRALQQAIYPEFRHDIGGNKRMRQAWTDLLILVSWGAFPMSAALGVIAAAVTPVLFGPGWELAAQLALPLAIVLAFQMVSTTLGSALEAVGRFRWILSTHLIGLAIQAAGAALAILYHDWLPALLALALMRVVQHTMQVAFCGRHGNLDIARLVGGYLAAAGVATIIALGMWAIVTAISGKNATWIGVIAVVGLGLLAAIAWRYRGTLPPTQILARYRNR